MPAPPADTLAAAITEAQACRRCEAVLPLGPRPVFRVSDTARILISSQAPGTKVHLTGLPFNDASGDRLRGWLNMDRDLFYDATRIAIVPMGLCYPRPAAKRWRRAPTTRVRPTLARPLHPPHAADPSDAAGRLLRVDHRLGKGAMTERVMRWQEFGPAIVPLPHPSWRTGGWERRNPGSPRTCLPALRHAVSAALD